MNTRLIRVIILFFIIPFPSFNIIGKPSSGESSSKLWNSWERVAELPFSMRDGVGVVHFKDEIWMLGGWIYGPLTNEIYKSSDGINWTKVGNGTWQGRHGAGIVAFNEKMWVMSGDGYPDVWSSEDGIDWTLEVDHAPWGRRYAPYVTVFDGKMWLMGGVSYWDRNGFYSQAFETAFNDVWSSEDGVNWKLETSNAPWGPRGMIHGSLVHKEEMWIIGGGSKNWNVPTYIYNDVWKTKNGVDWELVNDNSPWRPRIHFTTISFDNKIWVIDGTTKSESLTNDVWFSEDGKAWSQLISATTFPPSHASTAFVHDNSLFISAGYDIDAIYRYKPPQPQHINADNAITLLLEDKIEKLNINLSSGLLPSIQVQDTLLAKVINNRFVYPKSNGNTKLVVSHPGDYGFFPLDTTYIDLFIKQRQNTIVEVLPETVVQDTVRLNILAETELPISIIPNENIQIIDHKTFIPLTLGSIFLELVQEGDDNYASLNYTIEIKVIDEVERTTLKMKQSLIDELTSITATFGDTPIDLGLASTSGLPLTLQITDTTVAALLPDNRLQIKRAGSTRIVVSNEGNSDYYPLFTSVIDLVVHKQEQYLIHPEPTVKSVYGGKPVQLMFTTNSGLPITYSVADTSIAEVNGNNQLLIRNAGTTVLYATSEGDKNHHPLNESIIPIHVDKKEQIIQAYFPSEINVNEAVSINVESDSGLPVMLLPNKVIKLLSNNSFTTSRPGQIKVTLEQPGSHNYKLWSKEFEVFVINSSGLMVYPNPAKDNISISVSSHLGDVEKVKIFGVNGELYKTLSMRESLYQFNLSLADLRQGVYTVKVVFINGEIKTTKLVKI